MFNKKLKGQIENLMSRVTGLENKLLEQEKKELVRTILQEIEAFGLEYQVITKGHVIVLNLISDGHVFDTFIERKTLFSIVFKERYVWFSLDSLREISRAVKEKGKKIAIGDIDLKKITGNITKKEQQKNQKAFIKKVNQKGKKK